MATLQVSHGYQLARPLAPPLELIDHSWFIWQSLKAENARDFRCKKKPVKTVMFFCIAFVGWQKSEICSIAFFPSVSTKSEVFIYLLIFIVYIEMHITCVSFLCETNP